MSEFFTLVTTLGQTKLAAAIASGIPLALTHVAVGDGGGAAYIPNEAQLVLVGEKWRGGVTSVGSQDGGLVVIELDLPADEDDEDDRPSGGFYIREAGVFDADGDLILISRTPVTYKPLPASGASEQLTVRQVIDLGNNTGAITVTLTTNTLVPLDKLLRLPFLAVESATVTAPPVGPVAGDTYLVPPAGASGTWVGQGNKLASWNGLAWTFITAPERTIVGVKGGAYQVRTAGGWTAINLGDRYVAAGGTANAITATLDPPISAYSTGLDLFLMPAANNTGPATLNLNGLGALAIVRSQDNAALQADDLRAGVIVHLVYDGAGFVATNLAARPEYNAAGGTANALTATSATFASLRAGRAIFLVPAANNTAAPTLNVNGLGAVPIIRAEDNAALQADDLRTGVMVHLVYDGTSFVAQNLPGRPEYNAAGGTANALTATSASFRALNAGREVLVVPASDNTGAATLNVNALGVKSIVRNDGGGALLAGDLTAGVVARLLYDGAAFRLMNLPGLAVRGWRNVATFRTAGAMTWTAPAGVTRVWVVRKGGGAGGGGGQGTTGAGGGGGEAATVSSFEDVIPGTVYSGTVGAAGAGGSNVGGSAGANIGANGGSTTLLGKTAVGGLGGGGGYNSTGYGGNGGTASGGDIDITGVQGDPGYTPDVGGSGKGGRGGGARGAAGGNGTAGVTVGYGDGGAGGGVGYVGSAGGVGLIDIFW